MADTKPDDEKRLSDAKAKEVFDRAIKRFRTAVIPQMELRGQALEARRFVSIPGAQWEGAWGEQFANSIRMEMPKLQRAVRKIENDYRQNRIVPDFRPAGGNSNSQTADLLDGLHRADSYRSKAQQARDNAFGEAVKGGFGAYRLLNEYDDPLDPENDDQRINPGATIVDADQCVFFDPDSRLYDKSDARFAFVIIAQDRAAAEDEHGKEVLIEWEDSILHGGYDWYTPDVVRRAEYYEVEEREEKLWLFTHPLTGRVERWWDSDIDAAERKEKRDESWEQASRMVKRRRIHKYVLNGSTVLKDCGYVAGTEIPIVPVYGVREYVDGIERFKGHVIDKMDAQRLYNGRVSKLAEVDALAPREVPIFAPEQITGNLPAMWSEQNINRSAYLLANPLLNPDGTYASMGPIGKLEPPTVPPVTALLLQAANADLLEGDEDGADEVKANTSAEAMDIAAARVDDKSGVYLDNMCQSVQREGEIYLAMAGDVYFQPGRKVQTMSEDGDDGEEELQKLVTDPKTGAASVINDLQRGRYKVLADVTEATVTRRDKTAKRCLEMAQVVLEAQDVEGGQAIIGTAILNTDGEGLGDLQKWWRARLVKMGVVQPNEEEKQELAAAQEQQQPDPVTQGQAAALAASAEKDSALAEKAKADTDQSKAKTVLTMAQAHALDGPSEAPPVPDGLEQAERIAGVHHTLAQAEHIREQTRGLPEERRMKIAKGRDLKEAA